MSGNGRRTTRSRTKSATDADGDDPLRNTKPNPKLRKDRNRAHNSIRIFDVNLKVMLGVSVFAFFVIFFLIRRLVNPAEEVRRPRVVTPFPAPKIMDLPQFQGEHRESLYWGTYRPHVYLGIRARTPRSLLAGLMWIGVKDGRYAMRHVCQDSDELSTYGWTHHNGRDFGHQILVDQDMTLATSFLKSKVDGSGYGGDWAVRIDVQSKQSERSEDMLRTAHIFFYMADEDGHALSLSRDNLDVHEGSLLASGSRMDVGGWQLHLKSMDDLEVHYSGFKTNHIHNLSELVQENLGAQARKYGRLQLSDTSDGSPNILVFQVSARIPFKTDIVFVSRTGLQSSGVEERVNSLTGTSLTSQLKEKQREFDTKFEKSFNLADKLDSESMIAAELYTAVPSRPFFPRGFLWDEGFHQLLIWRWDVHISLDIIGHWLDLMNIDGWIPREQILGAEARSKVPEEFIPQHPTNGNPPTLILALRDIVHSLKRNKFTSTESKEISSFLERAYVRLEAWFQYFNTTQSGKEMSSYYWHGRDVTTTRELNPKMHLDNKYGAYFDFGNHTEKVRLHWKENMVGNNYATRELVRQVLERPELRLVPHVGYVSLFPFMGRIIPPESWILEKQLDLISNQSILWTDYGLRSLSKTSSLYMKRNTEHDPPYWRGPIWMNMNYMILSALHHYSKEDGPYRDKARAIYDDLRGNLIRNVVRIITRLGFCGNNMIKERQGKGARVFTGWTALVVLMMAEAYGES
ncbi:mannosyl-oligosaccharide glucosidase gcs1 [Quercus suber]|uniref:Mannosyl-oligosaccharide glucosidase n=1 Tax=Quercus suber TaxID=58331 RepID=A0AAW0JEP8_QUESU